MDEEKELVEETEETEAPEEQAEETEEQATEEAEPVDWQAKIDELQAQIDSVIETLATMSAGAEEPVQEEEPDGIDPEFGDYIDLEGAERLLGL